MAYLAGHVAQEAKLISLKATDCRGVLNALAAYRAMEWVINNAFANKIVSVSLAFAGPVRYAGSCPSGTGWEIVGVLVAAGAVPVAGAGNNGWKTGISAPACSPDTVAAGGVVYNGQTGQWGTSYSLNSGNALDILAPAAVTVSNASHFGTSIATTIVAGAIAGAQGQFAYPLSARHMINLVRHHGGPAVTDPDNNLTRPRLDVRVLMLEASTAHQYVGGVRPTPPPAQVATLATAPVTVLAAQPAPPVSGCYGCH